MNTRPDENVPHVASRLPSGRVVVVPDNFLVWLEFKAHILFNHSTLGLRVIMRNEEEMDRRITPPSPPITLVHDLIVQRERQRERQIERERERERYIQREREIYTEGGRVLHPESKGGNHRNQK